MTNASAGTCSNAIATTTSPSATSTTIAATTATSISCRDGSTRRSRHHAEIGDRGQQALSKHECPRPHAKSREQTNDDLTQSRPCLRARRSKHYLRSSSSGDLTPTSPLRSFLCACVRVHERACVCVRACGNLTAWDQAGDRQVADFRDTCKARHANDVHDDFRDVLTSGTRCDSGR